MLGVTAVTPVSALIFTNERDTSTICIVALDEIRTGELPGAGAVGLTIGSLALQKAGAGL
jgi:hypothetical protein